MWDEVDKLQFSKKHFLACPVGERKAKTVMLRMPFSQLPC
jgi:hypothetical protein